MKSVLLRVGRLNEKELKLFGYFFLGIVPLTSLVVLYANLFTNYPIVSMFEWVVFTISWSVFAYVPFSKFTFLKKTYSWSIAFGFLVTANLLLVRLEENNFNVVFMLMLIVVFFSGVLLIRSKFLLAAYGVITITHFLALLIRWDHYGPVVPLHRCEG